MHIFVLLVISHHGLDSKLFFSQVKTVDEYDPVRDVWISAHNMEARRSTLGVAMLNDHIYAVVSCYFSIKFNAGP